MKISKIIIVSLAIVILSAGLALGYQMSGRDVGQKIREPDAREVAEAKENLKTSNPFKGDDPLRILIFGIDETATNDMSAENNPTRSDVIMLATIDPIRKKAQLLSLPRDTYVEVEGHQGKTKLGHAYAYGGAALAQETVETFLDVDIDYYATVNYESVKRLVDAVGGIDVDIPFDYTYEDTYVVPHLYIDFKKGEQTLDGEDAVRYLRIRKIYENQDIDRIQKQQDFIMQLFEKVKKPQMILKIPELIDIALDNVKTDLNYGQIAYLAKFGLDFDREDIQTDTLVGENTRIGEIEYYVVDQDLAKEQLRRFMEGKGSYYQEHLRNADREDKENSDADALGERESVD